VHTWRQVGVARHMSHVTRHTSHVTRHTSHVTRHTSHVTRHTSHVTRHTSHVTRHTSHVTQDRWFSWVFGVGSAVEHSDGPSVYNPPLTLLLLFRIKSCPCSYPFDSGGHQGSRGGRRGQEFFIENVIEELDAPGGSLAVVMCMRQWL
jgi:hypothetical protein